MLASLNVSAVKEVPDTITGRNKESAGRPGKECVKIFHADDNQASSPCRNSLKNGKRYAHLCLLILILK